MFSLREGCNQIKFIAKLLAAIYVSLLYTIAIGSVIKPEDKVVRDLLFALGCVFAFSSINMYYRSLQSEESAVATVFPERTADEDLTELHDNREMGHIEESSDELEGYIDDLKEPSSSLMSQSMYLMKVVCGAISSAYRGGIAALLITSSLGLSGFIGGLSGVCFMLVFTLAKLPHFTETIVTENQWIMVPTRLTSSFSSALIAFRLVPDFSLALKIATQCVFSSSVFCVVYNADKRRVSSNQPISRWENSLIFGISIFYGLVATPKEISPFRELNVRNVILYSTSSVVLSLVFISDYRYSVKAPVHDSATPEAELIGSSSSSLSLPDQTLSSANS